jgi:hypothetical protein
MRINDSMPRKILGDNAVISGRLCAVCQQPSVDSVTRCVTATGVPLQIAAEGAERSAKRFEHGVADVMGRGGQARRPNLLLFGPWQ